MKYWIIINGAQLGPMELDELLALNPGPDTPVWHEGLEDWVAASVVPEIAASFAANTMPEVPRDNAGPTYTEGGNASDEAYRTGYRRGYEDASANRFYHQRDPYAEFGPNPVSPPTYLVGAILCTIFCCTIPGIVAIVYSTLVSRRFAAADYAGAENASSAAMWWVIISFVLGLISAPLSILGLLG